MTVNDPRPALAATLAARLAPAAEALAAACAEDAGPEPPPPDDRALAEHHRAARARLHHLRQLLPLLDWSARHVSEPEPQPEPVEEPWEPPPPSCPTMTAAGTNATGATGNMSAGSTRPNAGHGKNASVAAMSARSGRGRKPEPWPHGPAAAGTAAGRSMTFHDISRGPHDKT